jgi:hypothetical protein
MIKLKKIINESLQLPNGTKIEMGRIFTGQGKAFVKEEDLNEKKNPKREKIKKDFKTSLKFAKGVIRKIDTFMKSDHWGMVDGFVTDKRTGLVSIVKDMEKDMNQIIKMPVDESVNEAIEQETNISFEMIGKSYISVKGRKLTAKLQFKGNDLQDVVNGKKKKGKVVLASVTTK